MDELIVAEGIWKRARGLKAYKPSSRTVMVLRHCNSIHTFGMRAPIDVWGIDAQGKIVVCYQDLKPWRVFKFEKSVVTVVECYSSRREDLKLKIENWIKEQFNE